MAWPSRPHASHLPPPPHTDAPSLPSLPRRIAANALRNLATDSKTMDHMSVLDKGMVEQLVNECGISKWQLAIVSGV